MTTKDIQKYLNDNGYLGENGKPLVLDGISGANTKFAIKAYQKANGLVVDGIAGTKTQTKMTSSTNSNTGSNNTGTNNNTGTTNSGTDTNSSPSSTTNMFDEDYSKSGDTQSSYYGYTPNDISKTVESQSLTEEKFIEKAATGAGIINSNFVQKMASDPSIMAFYINALTYGGYQIGDILNDMKRREMIEQGNPQAKTIKVIDPTMKRSEYLATTEGQKSTSAATSVIPTFNFQGLLNPEILKYGADMPQDLFKTLVPILDHNSQEYKDAVANVKGTFYDLVVASAQATSEQEKAVADYNYEKFKEQINTQYGIALSDDATKAWKQIEDLEGNLSSRGIQNSGLGAEAIDDVLATTRKADQRLRQDKLTKEEAQMASTYSSSATPAQIKALIDEDIAKGLPRDQWRATKWGLVPSDDIKQKFSIENLRAQYPELTDAEIKTKHDAVLDENGNYRSAIYSKYYSTAKETRETQRTNAESLVLEDAKNKEEKAYTDYTNSTAFLGQTAKGKATDPQEGFTKAPIPETSIPSSQPSYTKPDTSLGNAASVAGDISKSLSSNVVNYNPNTGQKLTEGQAVTNNVTGQSVTQGTQASTNTTTTPPKVTSTTPTPTVTPAVIKTATTVGSNITSKSTADIQKQLGVTADGIFGPKTTQAVKDYQAKNGLVVDGIVGQKTLAKLFPV